MEYSRLPPRTHYTYVQSSRKVRCRKGDVVVSVRPPRKQRPTEKNSYSRSLLLTASWCSVKTVGSSMSEHQYYRPTRSLLVHIFFPPKSEEPRTLLLLLPLLLLLLVLQGCNSLSFGWPNNVTSNMWWIQSSHTSTLGKSEQTLKTTTFLWFF